jgi:hypothetical protein
MEHLPLCFVLMPFSREFKNQWDVALKAAISDAGLRPYRGDEESLGTNIIMRDVTKSILESRIIVADLTGRNPNVMYELGLAHAAKKPVIMLIQTDSDVPFDVHHIRYLKYDPSDLLVTYRFDGPTKKYAASASTRFVSGTQASPKEGFR